MTVKPDHNRAVPRLVLLFLILIAAAGCAQQAEVSSDADVIVADTQAQLQDNVRQGRVMQALYQLDVLANQSGWSPALQEQAGDLWQQVGDTERAVSYYAAAADQSPDVDLLRKLAQLYLDLGRWEPAVDTLEQLVGLDDGHTWANYQLGLIRAAFDPRAASEYLLKASTDIRYQPVSEAVLNRIAENDPSAELSLQIGMALAESELWPYAELAFTQAVHLENEYAEALAYLGLARDRQGKSGAAYIERAVVLQPQNPLVRYLQGLHLRHERDYPASLEALILATAYDPQNPAFYAELSNGYRLVDDLPSAERWLQVAVNVSGNDERFQRMLALFYSEEAYNLEIDGLSTLESATVQLPNDPELRAGFGWALHTMGETEAGLEQLDAALRMDADNPRALYYKARIWLAEGNTEDAAPLLARVAERESPYQLEAQRLLDDLTG